MSSSSAIRLQIEAALSHRIPSALTPIPKVIRPAAATGVESVDEILEGGLPLGAITEMVGPECSGRTALALSFIACMTQAAKVCAWIDVSDMLHPESAAAIGVDLIRLLWVRCGIPRSIAIQQSSKNDFALSEKYFLPAPTKKGLHGGGFGSHPRSEVKGLSDAIGNFLKPEMMSPQCAEPQPKARQKQEYFEPKSFPQVKRMIQAVPGKPWLRIEQALRVMDLLLQAGGFSAIVLDMGSIAPEYALRVPLATWFRYRTAAERTQTSILLLTQHACAKSSAELVLRLKSSDALQEGTTVFAGIGHLLEVSQRRFTQTHADIIPLKKLPQRKNSVSWHSQTPWIGHR